MSILAMKYEEKLRGETSKLLENAKITQEIISELQIEKKSLQEKLVSQESYLKNVFNKEQTIMLDKLREENDTIYNDVTSKIASIKASYEKKMTSLKAKYEERLRDLKEELSDFKELH